MFRGYVASVLVVWLAVLCAMPAVGVPEKNDEIPSFRAIDINGNEVDFDKLIAAKPDLLILFFFTVSTGEEIAVKLRHLNSLYPMEKLQIAAIGFKEDEEALRAFAEELRIKYYVISDSPEVAAEKRYGPFTTLPLTFLVTDQRKVLKVLKGSGKAEAEVINEVAKAYFQQRKLEEAKAAADAAVEAGEDEKTARSTKGFALSAEGKLDEAEKEFGQIGSSEGLAKVALERGDTQKAIELAPDSGYGNTIKATALMREGKLEDAATTFEAASAKPAEDWQVSEATNGYGRTLQEMGKADAAIERYQQAVALDPYNVVALSNEGAVHREKGDLEKATEVLERAQSIRQDDLVTVMLQQVQKEMEEANDIRRGELIRAQINDLKERYEALKAAGQDKPLDDWSSPPMVVAFLPSSRSQDVFFERAGTDIVLRRGIEARLQVAEDVQVVEREVLDTLLQELNLGSSEIASQDTQLQLGKVLAARMLGFVDYARIGPDTVMYLRLVDTETTALAAQFTRNIKDTPNIQGLIDGLVEELVAEVVKGRLLQGLIAGASDDGGIIINLGKRHGAKAGQRYNVIENGPPIEAGGKVIGYRKVNLGELEVTKVEDQHSVCKVLSKKEGTELAKDMKIKQAKTQ